MPSGIAFNPEAIATALFNLLVSQNAFTFNTTSRRGSIWSNVPPASQPYMALIERGAAGVQNSAIGLQKWTLRFLVLVYLRTDADPITIPATQINAALLAIANIMNSSPIGGKQTLGGLVNNAWIDGEVLIDTGIIDQQCALIIPISVECGL